ncbi:MAG: ABC transporter permease, partial [Bacteroidales bacterium]|nr:ABC transporter permease [Bacteroidales bacterium]
MIIHLKQAFRNLKKNKLDSFINIGGLATGIAIFFLITIYVQHEMSYDKFHQNYEDIYQVQIGNELITPAPVAKMIKENIPGTKSVARVDPEAGGGKSCYIIIGDNENRKTIHLENLVFADENIFDIFTYKALYGNLATALKDPYSIVLTRKTAFRLFGNENAVGKSLRYIGSRSSLPVMQMNVTAIIEDIPSNSSLSFNAMASFATLYSIKPTGRDLDTDFSNWYYSTYILVDNKNSSFYQERLSKYFLDFQKNEDPGSEPSEIGIISLADIPFYNNNKRQLILIIQLVGVFILIIAMINYINLTTAKSISRAKEIGIRKVNGAGRFELVKQFLSESLLISILGTPIVFLLFSVGKIQFNHILQSPVSFDLIPEPILILIFLFSILFIGIITGIYPALHMSYFNLASILKNEVAKGKKSLAFRFGLFVFQFVISIGLIICTLTISKQIEFIRTKPLGFNNQNLIHFQQSKQIGQNYNVFKQKLLKNPNILSLSRSNIALGNGFPMTVDCKINGEMNKSMSVLTIDPDFIKTMKIDLLEGRDFSWEMQSDKQGTIIVNETLAKEFNLKPALGAELEFLDGQVKAKVIGVCKDFYHSSFHHAIEPSVLWCADWNQTINIRINNQNTTQTISYIKSIWEELSPQIPFDYQFIDTTYNNLYKSENELKSVLVFAAVIAIIIACL